MEIILSPRCKSFTGTISRYHGYAIRRVGNRFFSQRCPGKNVPPDGHWKFILSCTELAKQGFMLTDIRINGKEVYEALKEAGIDADMYPFDFEEYNANWVLNFKNETGL